MGIYLDYAATSPMPDEVLSVYTDALHQVGNPSSIHQSGQDQRAVVENARAEIAAVLGLDPMELVFTSGGTESTNTWLKGRTFAMRRAGVDKPVWLLTRAEHHATLDAIEWLEAGGLIRVRFIDVDTAGVMDLGDLEGGLGEYDPAEIAGVTTLVANNEVGSVQPVADIAALARARGVSVHIDAIQAFGHMDLPIRSWGVDAVSISAHKIGGPVGMGVLAVSRNAPPIEGLHHGGGQQLHRSGTLDAPGAVAFARAVGLTEANRTETEQRLSRLSTRLRDGLVASAPGVHPSGDRDNRLSHIVHVTIEGCEGDVLLFLLDARGVRVSTGSACQAGVPEPSHVLLAMGLDEARARGALRMSLGPQTDEADIDEVLRLFPDVVAQARSAGMAGATKEPRGLGSVRSA